MKVSWDGPGLQVSEGDEVKVSRGIKGEGHARAHVLRNRTSGATFKRQAQRASTARNPEDLEPPTCRYARNILVHAGGTFFTLEEKPPPIIPGIFRECSRFLDRRLAKDQWAHKSLSYTSVSLHPEKRNGEKEQFFCGGQMIYRST